MKRFTVHWSVLLLAFGTLLMAAPVAARAQASPQEEPELMRDWTVRIGLAIFNSQTTRAKAGEVGFSGMVDRTVYRAENYKVNVGIGYNGMGDVYNVPILVSIIANRFNLIYGIGAGYSFGKRLDGRGISGTVLTLIGGYQLTHGRNPLLLDLRYNFISGANSELDNYGLTLGMQF